MFVIALLAHPAKYAPAADLMFVDCMVMVTTSVLTRGVVGVTTIHDAGVPRATDATGTAVPATFTTKLAAKAAGFDITSENFNVMVVPPVLVSASV